jgi:uncharacterized protein (DUF302 family)
MAWSARLIFRCSPKKKHPMKTSFVAIVAIFFLMSYGAIAQSSGNTPTPTASSGMFFENESKYDFDETVEKLKAEIEKKGWKLTATHDLQQTLKSYGKDVLPVKVLAVCHPKHSSKILEKDNERIVSCMMPCRISIYRKSDGKTYISRLNPAPMAKAFGGIVEQVMTESANEIEEMLQGLIVNK